MYSYPSERREKWQNFIHAEMTRAFKEVFLNPIIVIY